MQSKRPTKILDEELHLQCNKCKEFFTLDKFSKSKKDKLYKVSYECKACRNKDKQEYYKTKKGVVQTIWDSQLSSCKKRDMPPPYYTKEEFKVWIESQSDLFNTLWDNWVDSNYDTRLKPSVDRLDNFETYRIDNIRLTTWGDNKDLGHIEHTKANLPKQDYTPIYQLYKGVIINEFLSMSIAERETGVPQPNIWKVCNLQRHTAGGFGWKYKDETK